MTARSVEVNICVDVSGFMAQLIESIIETAAYAAYPVKPGYIGDTFHSDVHALEREGFRTGYRAALEPVKVAVPRRSTGTDRPHGGEA